MAPLLHIAILEADTPLPETCATYGTYAGVFASLLFKAATREEIPQSKIKLTGWDIVTSSESCTNKALEPAFVDLLLPDLEVASRIQIPRALGYPPVQGPDAPDAFLITGSRHNAFADDPWIVRLVSFTTQIIHDAPGRKLIGICFGHQIMGRALKSKVGRHPQGQWEVSVCDIQQTKYSRDLFHLEKAPSLRLFQMHQDVVYSLPEDVQSLGSSSTCQLQGMYRADKFISVQGHPEFTESIVREILNTRRSMGVLSEEVVEEAMCRVGNEHDGVAVAQGFIRFLISK